MPLSRKAVEAIWYKVLRDYGYDGAILRVDGELILILFGLQFTFTADDAVDSLVGVVREERRKRFQALRHIHLLAAPDLYESLKQALDGMKISLGGSQLFIDPSKGEWVEIEPELAPPREEVKGGSLPDM